MAETWIVVAVLLMIVAFVSVYAVPPFERMLKRRNLDWLLKPLPLPWRIGIGVPMIGSGIWLLWRFRYWLSDVSSR
jgi:hypothetical protein